MTAFWLQAQRRRAASSSSCGRRTATSGQDCNSTVVEYSTCWTAVHCLLWLHGAHGGTDAPNPKSQQLPNCLLHPRSLGLSATGQQYFSLRTNQPPATSQQYSSLRTNQHQSSATSQPNRLYMLPTVCHHGACGRVCFRWLNFSRCK
jgi:hypothetical protein